MLILGDAQCVLRCYGSGCTGIKIESGGTAQVQYNPAQGTTDIHNNYNNGPYYYHGYYALESISRSNRFINNFDVSDPEGITYCLTNGACSSDYIAYPCEAYLYCVAFLSCYQATVNVTSYASGSTADITTTFIGARRRRQLLGFESNNSVNVYCSAQLSCYFTIFIGDERSDGCISATNVICSGLAGCFGANFTDIENIFSLAHRGLGRTTIYSINKDVNIYVSGLNATNEATLYCTNGQICTVICDSYRSCLGLTVICDDACSNVFVNCTNEDYCAGMRIIGDTTAPTTTGTTTTTTMNSASTNTATHAYTTQLSNTNNVDGTRVTPKGTAAMSTVSTSTTLGTPQGTEDKAQGSDDVDNWIRTWEIGGYVALIGSFVTPVLLTLLSLRYHTHKKFDGCDKPNYFAIFGHFGILVICIVI